PVVTSVHDYHTHEGEKSAATEFIQKLQMMISDKIVFLTEHQKHEALKEHPNKEEKFAILPHPILKSGASHNLDHSKEMKFLFLGRVKTYKGYKLVLASAENEEISHITIAGNGDPIDNNISKINCINRHLTNQEISELLSTHHVLLLPYKETSQSGILTLGIDAGIPMILSQLPGLEEQLEKDCGIWIKPTSEAMIRIQSDKKLYDDIKEKLKLYKSTYQNNFQEKLDQLLDSLHRL
ncbi:hypothetical protein N9L92_05580, partial [Saprospiraceae bacterium]|nr:hypothetical protein [Saprospiraceae bacterium]